MTKRTLKQGITGKWGTRYGGSLRKISKKFEIAQHATYVCPFCCKSSIKRISGGIWKCKAKTCNRTIAGGCYELQTQPAITTKATLNRIQKELLNKEI